MAAVAARPQLVGARRRQTNIGLWSYFVFIFTLTATFHRTAVAVNNQCPSSCSCLGYLVDCSKKGLIDVPRDLPIWAEIIELQNNDITSIPDEAFRGLDNLKQIDLSTNKIRSLNSSSFLGLNALTDLKIHGNSLTEIPKLGHLPNLRNLVLHHNSIYALNGKALEQLPNLVHLDLNFNKIVDLPVGSFPNASSKLQQLSLNTNRIFSIEKGVFDNLTSLEWLKLNKNHIQVLHKDLFRQLNNLKYLELNRNQLTHIEGLVFQNLNSLEMLKLKRNNINQLLDGAFWGLNNIKHLYLDYNNINLISKGWLYGLTSLEQLTVSHNKVSEIEDDGWEFCKRLLELDLTFNELEIINKENFSKLQNLRYLYLDNNKISYIEEGTFKFLRSLQVLELKNNDISWSIEDTNGAFIGLERLTKLGLASNKIKSIAKKAFTGLNKLRTLDISQNPVTSIQENPFFNLKHLQTLSLDSESLLCDCSLKWLPLWLATARVTYQISALCGHPIWMRGISITNANPDNFTCDDFPKPYITEEPKTRIALKGANVTLVCKGAISSSESSNTTFSWRKDNRLLPSGGNNMETHADENQGGVTEYVSLLYLRNVQDQDEGRYQCVISNHLGSVYSQKAKITVHVFPVFTKTPLNVTVKAGSTARLECAVKGQPHPEIRWRKDGGDDFPAARERRMHVMPSDDVFFIVSVKLSDMGVYSCTAHNAAGTIVANATLQVQEIPSFVKPMEDKQTLAGETAVLECMASGSPKPRLNWTKDGGPLIPTERHFFTAEGQLLIIVQTQPTDTGRYVCEMTNALGSERDSAYLKVSPTSSSSNNLASGGEDGATTGIIIIAVVCCVVGTSLVWVVIIYQTRKRSEDYSQTHNDDSTIAGGELAPFHHPPYISAGSAIVDFKDSAGHLFSDSNSEHSSKDSGTGESAKQSNDELLSCDEPDVHCHRLLLSNRANVLNGMGGPYGGPLIKRPSVSSMLGQRSDVSDELSGHTTCDSQSPLLRTFQPSIHSDDRRIGAPHLPTSRSSWATAGNGNPCYYARPSPTMEALVHAPKKSSDNVVESEVNRWSCDPTPPSPVPFTPECPSSGHLQSQRCFSAEQLSSSDYGANLDSEMARLRLESCSRSSEGVTPSGMSSVYPRSLSLTTWSMGSLQGGQQDVPNDSGSFSIVSSETLPTSPRSVSRRTLFHTEPEGRSSSAPTATIDCEKNCLVKGADRNNECLDIRTIVPNTNRRYSPPPSIEEVT